MTNTTKLDTEALITVLVANLTRQIEWIKLADAKANFVFAVTTALLGLLAAVSPKTWSSWTTLSSFFAAPAIVFCVISLASIACAMFPRTWEHENSLIYFGGIAHHGAEKFSDEMFALSKEAYIQDLIDQCFRSAQIATIKFRWVQRALFWLVIAAPFWALALWIFLNAPGRGISAT